MISTAVERRFRTNRAPGPIERLSDNGSCHAAKATRNFAVVRCFTLVLSPESNGMSEVLVKTLKRDCVRITPLPSAERCLGSSMGGLPNTIRSTRIPRRG